MANGSENFITVTSYNFKFQVHQIFAFWVFNSVVYKPDAFKIKRTGVLNISHFLDNEVLIDVGVKFGFNFIV